MNIGIITFHSAYNYGAVLQCYALQKITNKLCNDCKIEVINYIDENVMSGYKFLPKNKKNVKCYIRGIAKYILYGRKIKKRFENFDNFMNLNYKISDKRYDKSNINNINNEYDILITGSDQVWNPNIVGELSDAYTLNFGKDSVNRISYAASIGNSFIEDSFKDDYKRKIAKIDHISVREEDAKKALEKLIDKKIDVVLDPTLLLNRNEWDKKIKEIPSEKEKYILAYVVEGNEEYRKIVNYLSEITGLKVVYFEKVNKYENPLRSAYTEGPLEFVNLIKNAEYVVATSFHATVFSIIFNKKFFIVPHKKTGSRVTNLLDKLKIENRTYVNLEDFKKIDYNFETDWEKVDMLLNRERQKSIDWLKNAIEG